MRSPVDETDSIATGDERNAIYLGRGGARLLGVCGRRNIPTVLQDANLSFFANAQNDASKVRIFEGDGYRRFTSSIHSFLRISGRRSWSS
jgi:hypothetical protein